MLISECGNSPCLFQIFPCLIKYARQSFRILHLFFRGSSFTDPLWQRPVCFLWKKNTFLYPFSTFCLLFQKAEELNIQYFTHLCNWKRQLLVVLDNEKKTRKVPDKALLPWQVRGPCSSLTLAYEQNICTL